MQGETTDEIFHDFTSRTPFERFAADIEAAIRAWQRAGKAGVKGLRKADIGHSLSFRKERYELYMNWDRSGNNDMSSIHWWQTGEHSIQRWFNVGTYMLLIPDSFSKRIQDDQEASTLLSALSIAMSSSLSIWPAFIPLHSAYRQRFLGVRLTLDSPHMQCQYFESESTLGTQLPSSLLYAKGHLKIFQKALRQHCPEASQASCKLQWKRGAYPQTRGTALNQPHYTLSIRHTLSLVPFSRQVGRDKTCSKTLDIRREVAGTGTINQHAVVLENGRWDDGAAWRAWINPVCPLSGIDIQLVWPHIVIEDPDMPLLQLPDFHPAHFMLAAFSAPAIKGTLPPQPLRLSRTEGVPVAVPGGFNELLGNLGKTSRHALHANDLSELLEEDFWLRSGVPVPRPSPEGAITRVLCELFNTDSDGNQRQKSPSNPYLTTGPCIQGTAPPATMLLLLALHTLTFSNARAIAELWTQFVRELRFRYWDMGKTLPRMVCATDDAKEQHMQQIPSGQDLSYCLLHQKLQLLDLCIKYSDGGTENPDIRKQHSAEEIRSIYDSESWNASDLFSAMDSDLEDTFWSCSDEDADTSMPYVKNEDDDASTLIDSVDSWSASSQGVTCIHPTLKLLCTGHPPVHIPELQHLVPLTDGNIWMERNDVIRHSEGSDAARIIQLRSKGGQLISDMAAFKAANPRCVFEDFIRWYSPSDWVSDGGGDPYSGGLSSRMRAEANAWYQLWEMAKPKPAVQQKKLFDPAKEGERVLIFLENVKPSLLFTELQILGAAASTHVLNQCNAGRIQSVNSHIETFAASFGMSLQQLATRDAHDAQDVLIHSILPEFCNLEVLVMTAWELERYLGCGENNSSLVEKIIESSKQQEISRGMACIVNDQKHMLQITEHLGLGATTLKHASSSEEPQHTAPKQVEWLIQYWSGIETRNRDQSPLRGKVGNCGTMASPHHMLITRSDGSLHVATAITACRKQ